MKNTKIVYCLAAAIFPVPVLGQITNGSFESGDLAGWVLQSGAVEVVQSSNFSVPIVPQDGSYYALLSTTPSGNPGVDSGQDRDNFDGNERDPAIITQTFNVTTPPETLSFSVAMLTDEEIGDSRGDIFECLLDGTPLIQGITANLSGSSFPFAGPFDGNGNNVTSAGSTNGSAFGMGLAGFQTVSTVINSSGAHTLECFIGDAFNDATLDSGLLLDNVQLMAINPAPEPVHVPTISAWGLLILSGLLTLVGGLTRRRKV